MQFKMKIHSEMPLKRVIPAKSSCINGNIWFVRYLYLFRIFGIFLHKSAKHVTKKAFKIIFQTLITLFWSITIYYHVARIYNEFQDVSKIKDALAAFMMFLTIFLTWYYILQFRHKFSTVIYKLKNTTNGSPEQLMIRNYIFFFVLLCFIRFLIYIREMNEKRCHTIFQQITFRMIHINEAESYLQKE